MKTKPFFGMLLLFLCTTALVSCNDDEKDPADTQTLNMLNEQNGKTILGESDVYINKANNFKMSSSYISDAGNAAGLGVKIDLQLNNLSRETAVIPGHLYQVFDRYTIKDFPSGNRAVQIGTGYYQLYVVAPITSENVTTGAMVKYVLKYPETASLPEVEQVAGYLDNAGEEVEIELPQDAEYEFQKHDSSGEKGAFSISNDNRKLRIALDKYPNKYEGPYGDYKLYIRSGKVFTVVIIKVGLR